MEQKFTEQARNVLNMAKTISNRLKHYYIGSEHLLVALLESEGVASDVLAKHAVTTQELYRLMKELITPVGVKAKKDTQQYTPRARRILEQSAKEAIRYGLPEIGTEHILLAILKEQDCIAVRLLNTLHIPLQKLYVDSLIASGLDSNEARAEYSMSKQRMVSSTPMLDQYSKDLTEFAKEGKLDPVIGREKEMERVIQILSRRTKNNPCLVGEPGVGKTAIVEGLARMLAEGRVPAGMEGKRVLALDLSGMVAGSKYRGEFEERIKRLMAEAMNDGNVLLFIDELHTIIGAGGAEGAMDASNIMKPALSRGELQVIGATTREEYRKYIEKDAALERRFQPVTVEEPKTEEAIAILKGLRSSYEQHHQVNISDEAIESAVRLSERYIHDRYLPDKAIDICDEAAARLRLTKGTTNYALFELREKEEALEKMYKLHPELTKACINHTLETVEDLDFSLI